MPAEDHPAYGEELNYLHYTLEYAEKAFRTAWARRESVGKNVMQLSRTYHSDNSQDYIDLMVNATLLSGIDLKLDNLEKALQKPYFARIDFRENGKMQTERLYIGKMCLMSDEDQQLVIVDWRAPVANMYYESRLGPAGYVCPEGEVKGELFLKRQFSIETGILREIFDIDITTNDQFLQSYLGASADDRLKDIVSTIQAEQNRVIRAAMERPLIVQGVAGSGKTTIALHRIAYLIYNYDKAFQPENFMIIAPNRLFLNYISEVLPELGVERVKQTTFADFALEVIGTEPGVKKLKVIDPNEKLILFLDRHRRGDPQNILLEQAATVKSGLLFKEFLDRYLDQLERQMLPEGDFRFEKWTLFTKPEIEALFFKDYRDWPLYQRIAQLQKHFRKRAKDRKEAIVSQLQNQCFLEIDRLKLTMEDSPQRQQKIIALIDHKNALVQDMNELAQKGVKHYLDQIPLRSAVQHYREFLGGPHFAEFAEGIVAPETVAFTRDATIENLDQGTLEIEDLAPLMYLKYRLYGLDQKIKAKHVVIDEAQDFNAFQFETFRRMIKGCSFTILGDLAQGIHSYRGTGDWEEIRERVFHGEATILNLQQSYRTTVEIMETANLVLGHLQNLKITKARPVIRHGEPVALIRKKSLKEVVKDISQKIQGLQEKGFRSFAVVGKTLEDCRAVVRNFPPNDLKPKLISGKEKEYHTGIVVVPSYLVKGLEFDAVFIAKADAQDYQLSELDIKLLYVALTRPLHYLVIYYFEELTPLLQD